MKRLQLLRFLARYVFRFPEIIIATGREGNNVIISADASANTAIYVASNVVNNLRNVSGMSRQRRRRALAGRN